MLGTTPAPRVVPLVLAMAVKPVIVVAEPVIVVAEPVPER